MPQYKAMNEELDRNPELRKAWRKKAFKDFLGINLK